MRTRHRKITGGWRKGGRLSSKSISGIISCLPLTQIRGHKAGGYPPPPLLRCFGDLPSTDLRKVFPRGCKKDEAKIKLNQLYTREPPKTDKVFCEKVSTTKKKKETTTSSLRSTYQQVNASNTSDEVFPRGRREPSRHDTQLLARRNAQ